MCSKYVLVSTPDKIENRFRVTLDNTSMVVPPSFGVSEGDLAYVITNNDPYKLQLFQFGMTPYYAEEKMNILNAPSEGDRNNGNDIYYKGAKAVFMKKEFQKPIRSQRCLVIADAYFDLSVNNKLYVIYLQNKDRPFAFAGIYDQWKNPLSGKELFSFAILTTTANTLLQTIGIKRMPVILSQSNELKWIKSSAHLSEILPLLTRLPADKMNGYPVSEAVKTVGFKDLSLLVPTGAKIQPEDQLTQIRMGHKPHKEKPQWNRPMSERSQL